MDGVNVCETWLNTNETGVLTVFAPSVTDDSCYIARLCGTDEIEHSLNITMPQAIDSMECVNMDESLANEKMEVLGKYEIKTIKIKLK